MEENYQDWHRFTLQAMERVYRGYSAPAPDGTTRSEIVQVIHEPSFETQTSVRVFRIESPDEQFSFRAIRTQWDQKADWRHFDRPVPQNRAIRLKHIDLLKPTIKCAEVELTFAVGRSLESRLRTLALPLPEMPERIGLDGETWRVRIGSYWMGLEYHWWNECPEAWRPLGEIVEEIWTACLGSDSA